MLRFILETGFMVFVLGAWGLLWYQESWQPPAVPADAETQIQSVTFLKLQSNHTRYRSRYFLEFEIKGEQRSVELPKHLPCCSLVKRLNELKPGSKIEMSWSNDGGVDYLNIDGGEAEITPRKIWAQYQSDWGMRWFLAFGWLVIAGWIWQIWYKNSLTPYLTRRSSGTAQKRGAP